MHPFKSHTFLPTKSLTTASLDTKSGGAFAIAKGVTLFVVKSRVKAAVARRFPHRPGREDFPHPVPRFSFISETETHQATPRWAHNFCCSDH